MPLFQLRYLSATQLENEMRLVDVKTIGLTQKAESLTKDVLQAISTAHGVKPMMASGDGVSKAVQLQQVR